jgi:hypothetical protein
MASSEEKSSSRSGLGWFPKLILWAAVIAFGYIYLSSVDREGGGTTASSMLDSIAKLSPVSLSSLPGFSDKEEAAAEVAQADEAPKTEPVTKPVAPAESAAFTRALVSDKPESSAVETPKPTLQPPVTYAAAALKAPAESTSAPVASAPAEKSAPAPAVSTPVEQPVSAPVASRPMPAPTAVQPEPMSPPPAMPEPSERAPMSRMPASEWAAMREQQRTEMMAQYEAMRREADERMRQYWGQMRESMPMPAAPYGHPGHAPGYMPGYAPGYAPGFYGPVR